MSDETELEVLRRAMSQIARKGGRRDDAGVLVGMGGGACAASSKGLHEVLEAVETVLRAEARARQESI